MSRPQDLHIFFLPFLAPGHMIPMVDLAAIFAARGVKSSIITTAGNAPLIQPTVDRSPDNFNLQLLTLPLPANSPVENVADLPSPTLTPEFSIAFDSLEHPFRALVESHRPDAIVSDIFYPWTADFPAIPRLLFSSSNAFSSAVIDAIIDQFVNPTPAVTVGEHEPFVVRGMPHRIELTRAQLMDDDCSLPNNLNARMLDSVTRSHGLVMNTVREMEVEYAAMMKMKTWCVGPVSLLNGNAAAAVRGGVGSSDCLHWLDGKEGGSVLYVSFGSLGRFAPAQLREIAVGLADCGHPFVWVIKHREGDELEWMPDGVEEKGLIVRGWAPQMLILNHGAVGGFLTHCGWNSCLEGASAGLPMITWPLFSEQFLNEKLLVEILRVGVPVGGAKVCSDDEAKRGLVRGEEVTKAVREAMGRGEEAEGRRKRAEELAETARKAVEEGGSSCNDVSGLIQELMDIRACKGKA